MFKNIFLIVILFLFSFNLSFAEEKVSKYSLTAKYLESKRLAEKGDIASAVTLLKDIVKHDKAHQIFKDLITYELLLRKVDDAFLHMDMALEEYPTDIDFLLKAGQIHEFYKKDYKKAIEYYKKVVDLSPTDNAYINLIAAYEGMGSYKDMLSASNQLLKKSPDKALSYTLRASAYLKLGKERKAIADLKKAIELDPEEKNAKLLLADIYINQQKDEEATKILRSISLDNNSILANTIEIGIADIYLNSKNYDKAIEIYEKLSNQLPNTDDRLALLKQLAATYAEAGKYKESAQTFERVISLQPNDTLNYYLAGKLYEYIKDLDNAERLYISALKKNPKYDEVLKRIAVIYILKKENKMALKYIDDIDEVARDVDFYLLKASAYMELKDNKNAKKVLELGLNENPTNTQLLYLLATVYEGDGNQRKAVEIILQALKEDPENHAYQNFLAYMYAELGENLDEALRLIKKALEKEPHNSAYLDTIAWVYFKKKEYRPALKYIKEALKISPNEDVMMGHEKSIKEAMK